MCEASTGDGVGEHRGGAVGDVLPAPGPPVVVACAEVDDDVGDVADAVDDVGIVGEQRPARGGRGCPRPRDVHPRRRWRCRHSVSAVEARCDDNPPGRPRVGAAERPLRS